jgi:hypothetical protein
MQVLIVFGIIAIIVLAIELSVIAYFAVKFFMEAFKLTKKIEAKEDDLQQAIKDTADFVDHTITRIVNKIIKAITKLLKK